MKPSAKACLAQATAILIVVMMLAAAAAYGRLEARATRFEPSPSGDGLEAAHDPSGVDWTYWKSVNADIEAWVVFPGTDISLPVLRAREDDPDFYLSHDVYRDPNPMGGVYLDSTSPGFSEPGNSVIFGHNWAGAVFGPLANYKDRDWALDHKEVLLLLPHEEPRRLQVQSADVIPGGTRVKRTRFDDERDFRSYWEERFEACDMKLAPAPADTNHLYTFVTCSYNLNPSNERTLVYAIEVADK